MMGRVPFQITQEELSRDVIRCLRCRPGRIDKDRLQCDRCGQVYKLRPRGEEA